MFENMTQRELITHFKEKYGIHFDGSYNPLVCDSAVFKKTVRKLAMDDDTFSYNPASNGVPAHLTLVNLGKVIEQLLPTRRYTEIGEPLQYGGFETNTAELITVSPNGQVEPYADYSGTQMSDVNATFPTRDVFRGQTNIQYGELEVATMSTAKLDIVSKKQYAAAMNIAIAQNKLFFFGNLTSGGAFINHNFGLLNDPGLNAAVPVTNGGSGSPSWIVKAGTATGAQDIANDVIVTAYAALQAQMGGNVSLDDEFYLCCSTAAAAYLNNTNSFGNNATRIIEMTMPKIKFIFAPEYATIQSFQLILAKAIGENPVKDMFSYKVKGHGVTKTSPTSFSEKWSFGSFGAGILQYAPIVTCSGIGC